MKQYCPVCDCEQKVKIVRKEETYSVKGEPITIEANVCTCAKCHEEIMSLEYDSDNLRRAYEKLEEICRRAVRMDPQEETVYCRLVRALMHQGKTAEAMKYCQEAESYLYSRMGIRPSKELRGLFAEH